MIYYDIDGEEFEMESIGEAKIRKGEGPLVSVVIPSYNHQKFVVEAIESVLNQSYPNIELIVIDDGSTDDSVCLIRTLALKHKFSFYEQENIGMANTLNRGMRFANGEYMTQLGSDDGLAPEYIETMLKFLMLNPNYGAASTGVIRVDENGELCQDQRHDPDRVLDFDAIYTRSQRCIRSGIILIRGGAFDSVGGYSTKATAEARDLLLKITRLGYEVKMFSKPLIYYRRHPTNLSKNHYKMYESALYTHSTYPMHPQYEKVINNLHIGYFIRFSKIDPKFALLIFRRISFKYYRFKLITGLINCLLNYRHAN